MAHFFNLKGFLEEFKAFALKGNVIDLAVAVVIGGAFNKIVSVFVSVLVCICCAFDAHVLCNSCNSLIELFSSILLIT